MPKKAKIKTSSSSPTAKIDKQTPKRKSTSSKKSSPPKKSVAVNKADSARLTRAVAGPTDEQIRTRAYFISERRQRFALPGDASSDWLEAKRQLLSEAGAR